MAAPRATIITGGTGALGRANVEAFLRAGDRVIVPWIDKAERDEVADRFREAGDDGRIELVESDVTDEAAAADLARAFPEVEVLVNGVGGFEGGSPVHETPIEVWDRLYRINVRTAVTMTHALLPGMLTRGRGSIVNVASQAALDPPAGIAAYSAAKSAVVALTRSLQNEVAGGGVRVNAVLPATIDTPANRRAMPDADFSTWTPPAEIARVILWLCSDEAAPVRGGLIPV